MSARDSPELFAACHVLHRLLAPRHPPRALCSLTSTQHLTRRPVLVGSIGFSNYHGEYLIFRSSLLPSSIQLLRCNRPEAVTPARPAPASPLVGGLQRSTRIRGLQARAPETPGRVFSLKVGSCARTGWDGGDEETRTPDPLLAKEMLCQLSYVPVGPADRVVGAPGLEPGTSALSGPRSNQLSYAPREPVAGSLHR